MVPKSVPPIGIGALGHPTFPNAIKTQNVIAPNTTFHPDKVLAENFHFEITHPDSNNPKALGAVPIPPENPKMFQNVVWVIIYHISIYIFFNWYIKYLLLKKPSFENYIPYILA